MKSPPRLLFETTSKNEWKKKVNRELFLGLIDFRNFPIERLWNNEKLQLTGSGLIVQNYSIYRKNTFGL